MISSIVVMGVAGSGKTHVGRSLARRLGLRFFDADDFHGPDNIAKMSAGTALTDADREDWLVALAALLGTEWPIVLACSALKAEYRMQLRDARPEIRFIYLRGDFETIRPRLETRRGHYFSGDDLLHSQFATLEEPDRAEAITVNVDRPVDVVIEDCLTKLGSGI